MCFVIRCYYTAEKKRSSRSVILCCQVNTYNALYSCIGNVTSPSFFTLTLSNIRHALVSWDGSIRCIHVFSFPYVWGHGGRRQRAGGWHAMDASGINGGRVWIQRQGTRANLLVHTRMSSILWITIKSDYLSFESSFQNYFYEKSKVISYVVLWIN